MIGDQTKNMLIGVFVIVGCSLIVSIILFLKPSVGDGKATLYVRFANINQIGIGTRVLFGGRPVGEVVEIQEIADARTRPTDSHGEFYFYQLVLKIDSSVKIYNTDQIAIQTSGLLGEKSVAIIPRLPPPGVVPKLIANQSPDQPLYADSTDPLENALNEVSNVASRAEETFRRVNDWLKRNEDNLTEAVASLNDALHQADIILQTVNQENLIATLKEAACNFSGAMHEAHQALLTLRNGNAYENLNATFRNLKDASHNVDIISEDLADQKGTLGKLIGNDDIYLQIVSLLSKGDIMMNDINHYGLLFHLNKGWQRIRTKRVEFLEALKTPKQFESYFSTEVDQINTSMSRLSMLIDKAETLPERQGILNNPVFRKDFADLLRQVDALADNLRLYNQQLVEAIEHSCSCSQTQSGDS